MAFTNETVDLETLPRFADVEYRELDASYAPVVLGVALAFQIPLFVLVTGFLVTAVVPAAELAAPLAGLAVVALLLFFAFLAWFSYQSARVLRYALREHDVIVQSGVFWRKETVQPIRRIQHVEQHQGPLDKRFGLYELKLFSAGTAQHTFRIPGLDAESASRIRQFILDVQEDGWGADEAAAPTREAPARDATTPTPAPTGAATHADLDG